jgi:signal peptidase I
MQTLSHPQVPNWVRPASAFPALLRGRLKRETRQGHILLCMALWSIISFLLISNFLFCSVTVRGASMEPTLFAGQQFLLNRWAYRLFPLTYGDLVVVRDPTDRDMLVKRIIALPLDTVEIRNNRVFVNNLPLCEDYLPAHVKTYSRDHGHRALTLKEDQYFVMGDNRLVSLDSRWYGPVSRRDLLGTIPR